MSYVGWLQAVSNVINGLGKLKYRPNEQVLQTLAQRSHAILIQFNPQVRHTDRHTLREISLKQASRTENHYQKGKHNTQTPNLELGNVGPFGTYDHSPHLPPWSMCVRAWRTC